MVFDEFSKHFDKSSLTQGKNHLIYKVANEFVDRFIRHEIQFLSNSKLPLRIVNLEKNLSVVAEKS